MVFDRLERILAVLCRDAAVIMQYPSRKLKHCSYCGGHVRGELPGCRCGEAGGGGGLRPGAPSSGRQGHGCAGVMCCVVSIKLRFPQSSGSSPLHSSLLVFLLRHRALLRQVEDLFAQYGSSALSTPMPEISVLEPDSDGETVHTAGTAADLPPCCQREMMLNQLRKAK